MSNNVPSIYIHRTHSECVNPDLFRDTFNRVLGADCVRCVDLVKKKDKNDIPFVRAFIHFKFWPRGETADKMYNELMTDKRLEITYNTETKWFWRFCRSKLPARDVSNAPPRKSRPRKNRYGDNNPTMADASLPPPVLKRSTAGGEYTETSQRAVSNKPAWMNANDGNPTKSVKIADFIDDAKMSDDGEEYEAYDIPPSRIDESIFNQTKEEGEE
jgi:hypothetical protein